MRKPAFSSSVGWWSYISCLLHVFSRQMFISSLQKIFPNSSAKPHYLLVRLPLCQRVTVTTGVPFLTQWKHAAFFCERPTSSWTYRLGGPSPNLKIAPTPSGVTTNWRPSIISMYLLINRCSFPHGRRKRDDAFRQTSSLEGRSPRNL